MKLFTKVINGLKFWTPIFEIEIIATCFVVFYYWSNPMIKKHTYKKKLPHWKNVRLYVIIMSGTNFRVNPHSIVCLNVKELLARSRSHIWSLGDSNGIRTHNHWVRKRTLKYLAKLAWVMCLIKQIKSNFIEIALLRHGCHPVNLQHISGTSFLKNIFGPLDSCFCEKKLWNKPLK